MAKRGWYVSTPASVGLVATNPKTILTATAPSTFGLELKRLNLSFDGVTFTAAPVLAELCLCTMAGTGTSSTVTPAQSYGATRTGGASPGAWGPTFTAAYNYSVEPTALTTLEYKLLSPIGAEFDYEWPLGREVECPPSSALAVRITAPANVNARGFFLVEPF